MWSTKIKVLKTATTAHTDRSEMLKCDNDSASFLQDCCMFFDSLFLFSERKLNILESHRYFLSEWRPTRSFNKTVKMRKAN